MAMFTDTSELAPLLLAVRKPGENILAEPEHLFEL